MPPHDWRLPRSTELPSQSERWLWPPPRQVSCRFFTSLCHPPPHLPSFHGHCDPLPAHWPDSLLNIIYYETCPCQVQHSSLPFSVKLYSVISASLHSVPITQRTLGASPSFPVSIVVFIALSLEHSVMHLRSTYLLYSV